MIFDYELQVQHLKLKLKVDSYLFNKYECLIFFPRVTKSVKYYEQTKNNVKKSAFYFIKVSWQTKRNLKNVLTIKKIWKMDVNVLATFEKFGASQTSSY